MEHSAKINLVSVSLDEWSIMAIAWLREHDFVFVFVSVFDQVPPNLPQRNAHLVSFPIRWFLFCPYWLSLLIIVPVFYQQRETGYSRAKPLLAPMHHMCYRGGIKKLFFFTFGQKGGRVSANPKKTYQKILIFFTIFDHFLTIFDHFLNEHRRRLLQLLQTTEVSKIYVSWCLKLPWL